MLGVKIDKAEGRLSGIKGIAHCVISPGAIFKENSFCHSISALPVGKTSEEASSSHSASGNSPSRNSKALISRSLVSRVLPSQET